MKQILNLLSRLLLFWLFFFFVQRLVFLSINFSSDDYTFTEFWICQLKALPMDIAAACYLLSIPVLTILIGLFTKKTTIVTTIIRIETHIMIGICSILSVGDAGLFKVWGTKINSKALSYLAYPQEVLPTVMAWENIGLFVIISIEVFLFYKLNKRFIVPFEKPVIPMWQKTLVSSIIVGLTIIGIRGGTQPVPINRNWVFFFQSYRSQFCCAKWFVEYGRANHQTAGI